MKQKIFIIFILLLVLLPFLSYKWYIHEINKPASDSTEVTTFTIEEGESIDSITERLYNNGLLNNKLVFKLYLKISSSGKDIQAGDFAIPKNVSIVELSKFLSKATNLNVTKVTIIEGLTYTQIADVLDKSFLTVEDRKFSKDEFISIVKDPDNTLFSSNVRDFLNKYKPAGKPLEGFLYPDTYEFDNDVSTKAVIETLLLNFISKTQDLNLDDNFYDDLILASIVEKESFTNEEKKYIASVFTNRLDIGMALQSDATVNYATGKNDPRPTYSDLQIDSPYNTYKYPGLPPTPICNPRVESIEASINPADTDYYYFIHEQTGSGKVHFAKTQKEHFENINKYLDN